MDLGCLLVGEEEGVSAAEVEAAVRVAKERERGGAATSEGEGRRSWWPRR